jgi:hypothetical protein
MRNIRKTVLILLAATTLPGCATTLTSEQSREYESYEAKGLLVHEKSPGTGAALGILPGGGSFYARAYGWGVVNLLLWPASVLWDPVSGYEGSKTINYEATKASLDGKMQKELANLDDQLTTGLINNAQYVQQKHIIQAKYTVN